MIMFPSKAKTRLPALLLSMSVLSGPAWSAEVRELSQNEIRSVVANGQSVALQTILTSVAGAVDGELVDVRSFLAGQVYYQVTILQADGSLVMLVVDGETGSVLPSTSEAAKVVRAAAKQSDNAAVAASVDGQSKATGNNGNAGGNGNGNSGGNGNGNSGGNGNGSSGGNGNGISGGNGNGNGKN
jgi:hypothetical protein